MANKIQIKRGTKAQLPALSLAEPGFCTDTGELFVGGSSGNVKVSASEAERTAWNAKETPAGAQAKANASRDAAESYADGKVGNLTQLTTNAKSNVVAAVNELFTSVSDGKSVVAAAITDKGVPTAASDPFATMADNISLIESGGLPNIGDWSAYATVYDWSGTAQAIPATSYGTFLDLAGSGWLVFVQAQAVTTSRMPNLRITVDGIPHIFTGVNTVSGGTNISNVVSFPIYFSSSIKIEVHNELGAPASRVCDYTVLLKSSDPSNEVQTALATSERASSLAVTSATAISEVLNITGSGYILAIEFSGYPINSSPTVSVVGYLTVDGVSKMSNRNTYIPGGASTKLSAFRGPIRFDNSVLVRHATSQASIINAITRVWYTLD